MGDDVGPRGSADRSSRTPTVPVLGFAAWSGTGKTTLLEAVLPCLKARGWRVAVIKHAHHAFDVDTPGKDSYRLREAGATPMVVASGKRFALMMETPGQDDPNLEQLIDQVMLSRPTLILVEGFKQAAIPKVELQRGELRYPGSHDGIRSGTLMAHRDPWVQAVICDSPRDKRAALTELPAQIDWLDLDDLDAIVAWIDGWARRFRAESDTR